MSLGENTQTVAMVTGAASGIGRAVAEMLLGQGAVVVALDRDQPSLEKVYRPYGDSVLASVGEVTDEERVARVVEDCLERFGGLDWAVNCAGISPGKGLLEETELDDFRRVWEVNVVGVFLCLKHQIPALRRRGGGAIVNLASVAALKGSAHLGSYAASKHAVLGLTRSAALENARAGIRINAVCPGIIDTPMLGGVSPEKKARLGQASPSGRLGTAAEVAQVVLFLLQPQASFVTGAAWTVDGGWTA